MNKELLQRIQAAGEYQRKAVYALFPEEMSGHLETIEKELKMMAAEAVMAFWKNNNGHPEEAEKQSGEKGKSGGQERKVRKVEITT